MVLQYFSGGEDSRKHRNRDDTIERVAVESDSLGDEDSEEKKAYSMCVSTNTVRKTSESSARATLVDDIYSHLHPMQADIDQEKSQPIARESATNTPKSPLGPTARSRKARVIASTVIFDIRTSSDA